MNLKNDILNKVPSELRLEDGYVYDGVLRRFRVGAKKNNLSGWYVGYKNSNSYTLIIGNWTTGERHTVKSGEPICRMDKEPKKVIPFRQSEQVIKSKIKMINEAILSTCPKDHPYLAKKKIDKIVSDEGIDRLIGQIGESLIIPVNSMTGERLSAQVIDADGTKRFKRGLSVKGGAFSLSDGLTQRDFMFLSEGFATAVSIYGATKEIASSLCVFGVGGFQQVIERLKKRKNIVICGDLGGQAEAKTRSVAKKYGVGIVFPITEDSSVSDFNDLHAIEGLPAVRNQLASYLYKRFYSSLSNEMLAKLIKYNGFFN